MSGVAGVRDEGVGIGIESGDTSEDVAVQGGKISKERRRQGRKQANPLTKNTFSEIPFSCSNSLLVTFFSAASTIPGNAFPGYFFSLSAFASSSFFFVAADVVGAAAAVEVGGSASTAMASVESEDAVKGLAEAPGARMPTTVPA